MTLEAIGENEEGGRPQTHENPKAFTMSLGGYVSTASEVPNGYGADDGKEAEDEADIAEELKLGWFHKTCSIWDDRVCQRPTQRSGCMHWFVVVHRRATELRSETLHQMFLHRVASFWNANAAAGAHLTHSLAFSDP